jgi:hypothetical protein
VGNGGAPSKPIVFSLGLLFPVGLNPGLPPAVDGLDSWVGAKELLAFGDVTDAPRPLGIDSKPEGIRRPLFDGFGYIGNVGA